MEKEKNCGQYDDIIGLARPVSKTHPPMSRANRAAQFSPFAALGGYHEAIREVTRETVPRRELGEDEREEMDRKLRFLQERLREQPEVTVTYFLEDGQKEGGQYLDAAIRLRRIDFLKGALVAADGTRICLEDIAGLSGRIFDGMFVDGA